MFSCFLRSARSSIAIVCRFAADVVVFLASFSSSRTALIAENLFLRKQLAFYQEHQVTPRRLTDSARLALVFWSRFFHWRSALVVVQPATLVGWHRRAFRLFWKWKSRPGRPRLPQNLRQLIARMVQENPTWGEERIADELWLKLGLQVSPRTIRAYWPDMPATPRRGRPQAWSTFVRNHAQALLACDFMVAITVRIPYPLYIGGDGGRVPSDSPLQSDISPNCRVDDPATARSDTQ